MSSTNRYYCKREGCEKQTVFKIDMRRHIKKVHNIIENPEIRRHIGCTQTLDQNSSIVSYELELCILFEKMSVS
jgi:hypothetical protein